MDDLVSMAVLDGTDDLLEEPTSFVLGHLSKEGGEGQLVRML
jgi:hypothetical protein